MDMKYKKIISASVIGIFAVLCAVIAIDNSDEKWLKVGGYTDYDDVISYCFGYVTWNKTTNASLWWGAEQAARSADNYELLSALNNSKIEYISPQAVDILMTLTANLPNTKAVEEGRLQYFSDLNRNKKNDDDIRTKVHHFKEVTNTKTYKICIQETEYFLNGLIGPNRPADAPKLKPKKEPEFKPKEEPVRWCYATYAPHGAIWSSNCYDTKKECNSDLKNDRTDGRTVNTKSCYKYEEISGYCLDDVYTGETRLDDFDNSEYKVTTQICTKTLEECSKFTKYQDKPSDCYPETINVREAEANYLTPDKVKKKILNTEPVVHDTVNDSKPTSNKESVKDTDSKTAKSAPSDPNKCNDFRHAENQQQAFEKLGLDWKRTKSWGAFVDVNNVLRADKPSCREIVKDSAEYNKYKRK